MSTETRTTQQAPGVETSPGAEHDVRLDAVLDRAVRRVAPLWPLKHFVAVNPFFGLADHDFSQAARRMARVAGARMTLPRSFYAEAIRTGRITDAHLEGALERAHAGNAGDPGRHDLLPREVVDLRARALAEDGQEHSPAEPAPTVSDVATRTLGTDWSHFVVERISLWAGAYFDEGQAAWNTPFQDRSPWAAWRAEAEIDRTPEIMGLAGFREFVRELPEDPRGAVEAALARLQVPEEGLELYLHRLLMTVSGWAAWGRYRLWEAELYGRADDVMTHILAIRLAWEAALLERFSHQGLGEAWAAARSELDHDSDLSGPAGDMQVDLVLQDAFELAWQEEMVGRFHRNAAARAEGAGTEGGTDRPAVQAAFCIDVRSEVFRRALEAQDPQIETKGFAGFFGFSLEVVPAGGEAGGARCPVLLTPAATLEERVHGDPVRTGEVSRLRGLRRQARAVWKSFKMGAVSCFGFVGPVGLAYAGKLVGDGLGLTRPVPHPEGEGLTKGERAALRPDLTPGELAGRATGLTPEVRLETAVGVLNAMALTDDFARIVLLAGHGSTTVNNPHATGLDCGACGGHTGEANARVAAAVLNDPEVRAGLASRGISIPEDTWFLAGLHDTTTDEVKLFDVDQVPAELAGEVRTLQARLEAAGRLARAERAPGLNLPVSGAPSPAVDKGVLARSRDWSQVRPEWGLAGCAAFVAAPRDRTRGLDLGGRSFLHDYVWKEDEGFGVLELIMTAPMVVASWISLQYYGSTVDNRAFGCGNKTLHNVVGTLGVLEGNAGDLRTGLPWQSVHDGERYVHEPLRLNVVIEAPQAAMNDIIERHEHVRHLLDNGWLNLWQMDANGALVGRYEGGLEWAPVTPPAAALQEVEQVA